MNVSERAAVMVESYGEVCSKRQAGRILHRGRTAIETMLADGRLCAACEGRMVDVRSIAAYIMAAPQKDEEARLKRIQVRNKCQWSV